MGEIEKEDVERSENGVLVESKPELLVPEKNYIAPVYGFAPGIYSF